MKGEVPKCSLSTNANLLLYDLYSLCSFIHCQPLYFAYFIFFFPYLLRFLSFLTPLLFSTSLLLLSLFAITPHANNLLIDISNSQCGFFLNTFQTALDALLTRLDGDLKTDHLNLIEPLASLVIALESCTEHAEPIQVVDRNRVDGDAANQAIGNENGRITFGEELEWKISASDSLIRYENEADTVEVSQEKESAEWENHLNADSVSQLPTLEVRDHVAEDHPKTRGQVSQENESQHVMTLTPESPVFDSEISSNTSQGLIRGVGGESGDVAEVAPESDPEAHKSHKETAFFSCDSFEPGLKTTTLGEVGEKHSRIVLGNDPEAYESPDATSSSSESYGFDLETESSASQPLTCNMGGSPAQGGNDIGNLGCELETASMASQELHEIPNIGPLRVGRFGSGLKTAGSAPQPYAYKVSENYVEDFNGSENASRGPSSPDSMWSSPGGFGSTRREKEWRRTLACKLYEERMTVDSVDGMDSLWEAYDSDSGKMRATAKEKRGSKEKEKIKKSSLEQYKEEDDEDEDDDYDDDEGMDAKLCCLQALRFSAAKMNLGMRRPSLVKISKAFKGMGMLMRGKGKSFR